MSGNEARGQSRLLLYARLMLILGVCSAFCGLLAFMNVVVPFVFGSRFAVTNDIIALLALVSLLAWRGLNQQRLCFWSITGRVPWQLSSVSSVVGLAVAAILAILFQSVYGMFGRLIGEVFGFIVTMAMLRPYLGKLGWRPLIAGWWAGVWIVLTVALDLLHPVQTRLPCALVYSVVLRC